MSGQHACTRADIISIGVLAPGLDGWPAARAVLAGEAAFVPADIVVPPSPRLAAAERRRLNVNARWALAVASEALAAAPEWEHGALNCVFASADGDGDVLAQTLDALARSPVVLSPTLFHNSVFNAPAGYCSIAHRLQGASTSVCAAEFTFGAALVEAFDQVTVDGVPVLFVAVDTAYPRELAAVRASVPSLACALLLRPAVGEARSAHGSIAIAPLATDAPSHRDRATTPGTWEQYWRGDTGAAALPLLAAIAQRAQASVAIAQPECCAFEADYRP